MMRLHVAAKKRYLADQPCDLTVAPEQAFYIIEDMILKIIA